LSGLVASPLTSQPLYGVAGANLVGLSGDAGSITLPATVADVGYVG
jgi:hypothetical protein